MPYKINIKYLLFFILFSIIISNPNIKVKKNILGLIPLVENMPSSNAMRPGDIIKTGLGKTIEVINTDAECPFFKAADYGIVGDAFEVVPKMIEAIKQLKA